jgi:chromate transporter
MKNLRLLAEIYLTFLKLGSVSFGGGYAIISLIQHEVVENKKWIDKEKIVDIFAVAQSLPGAIALNSSAFVGYYIAGIPGAVFALFGNLTPSVLIMLSLSVLFLKYKENTNVLKAFSGIRPVVVGLIIYAAYRVGKVSLKDFFSIFLAAASLIIVLFFNISVITVIITGIASGLLLFLVKRIFNLIKQCKHLREDK